jgi:hypothetical protein
MIYGKRCKTDPQSSQQQLMSARSSYKAMGEFQFVSQQV